MTGLEITLNGERVTVATLNSEYGVISAIVSCSNLLDKEGETVTINVAGIDSQTRDKLQWFSKELQPLDEIGIRIVTSGDSEEWQEKQAEIIVHVVEGRRQLGLSQEWVARNAGYSITQYAALEGGARFLEFEDFLRIGVVFYTYQESLSPAYIRAWNSAVLFLKSIGFEIRCYLKQMQDR